MNSRGVVPEDPRLRHWGEFFLAACLAKLMSFDEFMREPEAIVAALSDPLAPAPASLPVLDQRIAHLTRRNAARPAAGGDQQQQPVGRSHEECYLAHLRGQSRPSRPRHGLINPGAVS